MRKRLLSLVLALAVCLGLTAVPALAPPASAHDMGKPGQANKISAGTFYSGYVDANGSLWMWGRNHCGALGNGSTSVDRSSWQTAPVKVMNNVVSVSASDGSDVIGTAAVQADGSLWMWGANTWGQLGNGGGGNMILGQDGICQTVPVKVMDNVSTVSCGTVNTAAVKTDGSLWTWGRLYGDTEMVIQNTPVKVMDDVAAVSCGGYCTAAIKTDGSLWTWGRSEFVGNGYEGNATWESVHDQIRVQTVPVKIMDNVAAVSCGTAHAAAVKTDGSLWVWGTNDYSQLGIDGDGNETIDVYSGSLVYGNPIMKSYTFQSVPVKIMDSVSSVCCGASCTAAIKTDGSLWTWGENAAGQQSTPVKVLDNVAAVSCSISHILATKSDGSLWTWGVNVGGTAVGGTTYNPMTDSAYRELSSPVQVTTGTQTPVTTTTPTQTPAVQFSDVAADAYYAEPVQWAVSRGITTGASATTFSPDETCTVAQILTFLYRANSSPQVSISNPFTDVSTSDYYYSAALWAYQKGLVSGSTFGPSAPCTRSMVVTYLWKLAGSPETAGPTTPTASSPEYAPYTLSGIDTYSEGDGSGTGQSFTIQFDAAVTTQTRVTLHNDSADGDMVRDYWEPRTYDITLVAVRPDSKYTIDGGFYGETAETMSADSAVDVAWINGVPGGPYFRANDDTFRFTYVGRGYLDDEFALFEDSLSRHRSGEANEFGYPPDYAPEGCSDCGILIQLDGTYYFVTCADSAIAAGLLGTDSGFTDVPSSASYAQAVAWAVEKGITTGDGANMFSPDKTCTRGQIVTFLHRAYAD